MITRTRLENLADGVFAIVLTLLVMDLKMPTDVTSHQELITGLLWNANVFMSYLLVFATLTSYWFSHHHLLSHFWKKIDRHISNMNILFLFFLSLLPFTANLLGRYSMDPTALRIYGLNVLWILGSLILMRYAIARHPENVNELVSGKEKRQEIIQSWITAICIAAGMIMAQPGSTIIALCLFIVPRVLAFIPHSMEFIDKYIVSRFWKKHLVEQKILPW